MRIYGPSGTSVAANAPPARRAASGTFSLDNADGAKAAREAPSLRTIGGIDALIALQGVEDPTERRRRAVRRGRSALDALDALKLGLLAGALDTVLAEIELRVEVELAKFAADQPGRDRAK